MLHICFLLSIRVKRSNNKLQQSSRQPKSLCIKTLVSYLEINLMLKIVTYNFPFYFAGVDDDINIRSLSLINP